MKKQILLLVMMLLPYLASAATVKIDGIYYNLVSKIREAEVVENPNKYEGNIVIPSEVVYEDIVYKVTSIGNNAFGQGLVTSIIMPNTITEIKGGAFVDCYYLSSLTISQNVKSIGSMAFYNCNSLISISIPQSVSTIGTEAFRGCNALKEVHIEDIVSWCKIVFEYFGNPLIYAHHLFLNGEEIRNLIIPNDIIQIGQNTFINCESITSVTISEGVTDIGISAFYGCNNITALTIANSVVSIKSGAFADCYSITSLKIPEGVSHIDENAFHNCYGLDYILVNEGNTYYDSRNNCNALIETSTNKLLLGCNKTIIPNSVTAINNSAFRNCSGLTSITIPNSVTSIGWRAFQQCTGLTSVTIGNSVTSIGSAAFAECSELADVYCYAEKVPSTQSDAFENSYIECATLHVPDASLEDYKNTAPWSGFGKIEPLESSGVEAIDANGATISNYFTLDGQRIEQPRKGVNIVRLNDGTVKKVVIK